MLIPFNRPHLTGNEFRYIQDAVNGGQLAGNGPFTRRCHDWLTRTVGSERAFLTHSCTAALEMAALLTEVGPGDEVIMPSFTFVSTANAFVLRGATPVFVDIRPDTLNLDERCVEAAITPRTKVIVAVHYAGVACEMDALFDIARRHHLLVVEDAAQALLSTYRDRPAGSFGHFACLSFHETKNVISGEGGALLVNDSRFAARAEILWEKGTDRSRFFRGEIEKYRWVDLGSSFLAGELTAAFLWAQLEHAQELTAGRRRLWQSYADAMEGRFAGLTLPYVPEHCTHNAHMFQVLLPPGVNRSPVLARLNAAGVNAVSHYVPLHSAPAGIAFGRTTGPLPWTDDCSERLIRLPLWAGLPDWAPAFVADRLREVLDADSVSAPAGER
jgi:dTDP-4-amino-4,6-dideoxygalactose transaminase